MLEMVFQKFLKRIPRITGNKVIFRLDAFYARNDNTKAMKAMES